MRPTAVDWRVRSWRVLAGGCVLAAVVGGCLSACQSTEDRGGASSTRRVRSASVDERRLPEGFGVERAIAVTARVDFSDEQIFARGDAADLRSETLSLVHLVTLLAGLRSGVIAADSRHVCDGYDCSRTHGEIGLDEALALPCDHFFADLAGRLGSASLGASFASLGLTPPPIPEDRTARIALATRGVSWLLSPREALVLARGMVLRPPPWSAVIDEGLVPRNLEAGLLRGELATMNPTGWFVGYVQGPDPRLVVVRVSGCGSLCDTAALRVARWTVDRARLPRLPFVGPPGVVPAGNHRSRP